MFLSIDEFRYRSGAKFIGHIHGSEGKSGWGVFRWCNGDSYEGNFAFNKREGNGMKISKIMNIVKSI